MTFKSDRVCIWIRLDESFDNAILQDDYCYNKSIEMVSNGIRHLLRTSKLPVKSMNSVGLWDRFLRRMAQIVLDNFGPGVIVWYGYASAEFMHAT